MAQDLVLLRATYGVEKALEMIKKRRGTIYDPRIADHVLALYGARAE
jgi:hypothetical protein